MKQAAALLLLTVSACAPVSGQSDSIASTQISPVQVCCRSLPKWSNSRNPVLRGIHQLIIRHIHHCYINFRNQSSALEMPGSFQSAGIHPLRRRNADKEPMISQTTDNIDPGGACRGVKDVTEEKLERLAKEIAAGTCYSCEKNYHNHVLTACYNNSNTYVYDMISGAGMTPPEMKGAPGYRKHHSCRL